MKPNKMPIFLRSRSGRFLSQNRKQPCNHIDLKSKRQEGNVSKINLEQPSSQRQENVVEAVLGVETKR